MTLKATSQEDEKLEALRQEYETVLTLLESHFLEALSSKDWSQFEEYVDYFRVEVITKDLHRPGDDLLQKTQVNES
jgi:hypothetical protein